MVDRAISTAKKYIEYSKSEEYNKDYQMVNNVRKIDKSHVNQLRACIEIAWLKGVKALRLGYLYGGHSED